jgi:NRPS condensation-like uncharacterized protein
MKTEFKFGDKKIKVPCRKILKSHKGISLSDAMFCKYNLGVFNKFCEDISKNMTIYHKKHSKASVKYAEKNKSSGGNKKDTINISPASEHDICSYEKDKPFGGNKADSIDILPAGGHDICSYLVRHGMANFQIQAIMKLDGRLDFDKLKRAVRLSVDAEPVFGCRFVEEDPPYWKRLDNIDEVAFCSLEETDYADEAVMRFLQSPLDMDNDPKVKVKIIRSKKYDILGVKVNHACCDGAGTKEYIQLLSDIYSCIDQEDGTFIPKPRIGGRKDQDRLFDELGITCPEIRWNPLLGAPKTLWPFRWTQRGEDPVCFAVCRLPQGSLKSIYQYGKSRGATVNDLILTAFYKAMFKISEPINGVPMDILSTIDLRRYLPGHKTQAIRNLSGGFVTRIASMMNESFDGTLSRVVHATKKIKDMHPGVNNAMGAEYVEKSSYAFSHNYFELISQASQIAAQYPAYSLNLCFPGLSNLGYISRSVIRFGKNVVTDAYIIPPVIRAPGFLLLASSYNDILTLSIGHFKASISQRDMQILLNKIENELMRGCEEV